MCSSHKRKKNVITKRQVPGSGQGVEAEGKCGIKTRIINERKHDTNARNLT